MRINRYLMSKMQKIKQRITKRKTRIQLLYAGRILQRESKWSKMDEA